MLGYPAQERFSGRGCRCPQPLCRPKPPFSPPCSTHFQLPLPPGTLIAGQWCGVLAIHPAIFLALRTCAGAPYSLGATNMLFSTFITPRATGMSVLLALTASGWSPYTATRLKKVQRHFYGKPNHLRMKQGGAT